MWFSSALGYAPKAHSFWGCWVGGASVASEPGGDEAPQEGGCRLCVIGGGYAQRKSSISLNFNFGH